MVEQVDALIARKSREILRDIHILLKEAHSQGMSKDQAIEFVVNSAYIRLYRNPEISTLVGSQEGRTTSRNLIKVEVIKIINERRERYDGLYKKIIKSDRSPKAKAASLAVLERQYFGGKDVDEIRNKDVEKREERNKQEKRFEDEKKKFEEWDDEEAGIEKPEKKKTLGMHVSEHVSGIVGTVILLIIGMVLAALMGNMWFFLAFFSWAVYNIFPAPMEDYSPIQKRVKEIKKKLNNGEISAEQAEALSKTEAVLADLIEKKDGKLLRYRSKMSGKYAFKLAGFIFFTLAFAFAPLLKPVAIVIALIAYFLVE